MQLVKDVGFNPVEAEGLSVSRTLENMIVILLFLSRQCNNVFWPAGWKIFTNNNTAN